MGSPDFESHHSKTQRGRSRSCPAGCDTEQMMSFYEMESADYPGTLPKGDLVDVKTATNAFYEPQACKFSVRSQDYLTSKVKVKSPTSLLRFGAADLLAIPGVDKLSHACSHEGTMPALFPDRKFVVLNWQLPASPPFSFVVYYVFPTEEEIADLDLSDEDRETRRKAMALLEKFMSDEVTDEWRNNRFKLIPQIVEGPWLVRKATPSNIPALIGNKLTTTYHRGANYIEVDVDITSSSAANAIWGLISKTLSSLVIDLAFLIQGNNIDELPEALFGAIRISRVSLTPDYVKQLA